jgi:Ser/Thr protein kinase RdoA (MazF antagonist)
MNLSHAELHALVMPVLDRYGLRAMEISLLAGGLINFSLRVATTAQEVLVLQRLHPVFEAAVNDNLDLVTQALRARGAIAPTLIRTLDGNSAVTLDAAVWRLQTFMPGHSVQQLSAASQAHAAGDLLGRFHATLADWAVPLPHVRPPVHEPARHLAGLAAALAAHHCADLFQGLGQVAIVVERVDQQADQALVALRQVEQRQLRCQVCAQTRRLFDQRCIVIIFVVVAAGTVVGRAVFDIE